MILFEVDATGVTVFERNAPRSVDMDRIARRFEASQGVEIKAGDIHFFRPHNDVQAVQSAQDARLHLGINLSGASFLAKFGKALAFEAPDHNAMSANCLRMSTLSLQTQALGAAI